MGRESKDRPRICVEKVWWRRRRVEVARRTSLPGIPGGQKWNLDKMELDRAPHTKRVKKITTTLQERTCNLIEPKQICKKS